MLAPSVEVLVDNPSELADKIEKHASSLRGKTAPKAKEILQMECDNCEMDVIFIVQINTSQCFMIGQQPCWIIFP